MNIFPRALFTICLALILLAGCAAPLSVQKLQDFTPQSRSFVLLDSTQWDSKLRMALTKRGLKVKRFSTVEQVVSRGEQGEIARIYREAEARYGLSFSWEQVDRCVYNSSLLINGTLEVTDLATNDVILVIEKGGWTGPCADPRGMVFDDLAKELARVWGF